MKRGENYHFLYNGYWVNWGPWSAINIELGDRAMRTLMQPEGRCRTKIDYR